MPENLTSIQKQAKNILFSLNGLSEHVIADQGIIPGRLKDEFFAFHTQIIPDILVGAAMREDVKQELELEKYYEDVFNLAKEGVKTYRKKFAEIESGALDLH